MTKIKYKKTLEYPEIHVAGSTRNAERGIFDRLLEIKRKIQFDLCCAKLHQYSTKIRRVCSNFSIDHDQARIQ